MENTIDMNMSFDFDAGQFDGTALRNLVHMIYSREHLINKATGCNFNVAPTLINVLAICVELDTVEDFIQLLTAHDAVYGAGLHGIEIAPQHVRINGFGEAPDVRTLKAYGQLAVLRSIMATKPVHAPRSKRAAGTQAEPVSVEALHASANVFQDTMSMLLARNIPAAAPAQPAPPPAEAAPTPAPRQPRNRHLFADYAWEWFESYKVSKLRPGTELNYRLVIRKHLVPFFGDMRLDEINTVDVQWFYNQHAHKAKSSVRCMGIILHGIFDSAIEVGLCVIDPTRWQQHTWTSRPCRPLRGIRI